MKDNEIKLGDAISNVTKHLQIDENLNESRITTNWSEYVGQTAAKYTQKMWLNKKVLYIVTDSAPLKQELFMLRDKIAARINEDLGANTVNEVVIR